MSGPQTTHADKPSAKRVLAWLIITLAASGFGFWLGQVLVGRGADPDWTDAIFFATAWTVWWLWAWRKGKFNPDHEPPQPSTSNKAPQSP